MTDLDELGRRAVACKHWRWMPGMRARRLCGGPIRMTDLRRWVCGNVNDTGDVGKVPDLTDPATLGCVEQIVIDAYGGRVVLMRGNDWWTIETDYAEWSSEAGDGEYADGLVAALEAAP
jgi:hypothetical protein